MLKAMILNFVLGLLMVTSSVVYGEIQATSSTQCIDPSEGHWLLVDDRAIFCVDLKGNYCDELPYETFLSNLNEYYNSEDFLSDDLFGLESK